MMNIGTPHQIIDRIAQSLSGLCGDRETCYQHAWWLLEALTHKTKIALITHNTIVLSNADLKKLEEWVYQLVNEHKPIQYILGTVPFLHLDLFVEPPILIPRPETEEWVSVLLQYLHPLKHHALRIADIGTGTGCIALALGKALPHAEIVACDINPQALDLAARNAAHNNITNVQCVLSDLFENISGKFDIIVSNPPYITPQEYEQLDPSVVQWEDHRALVASDQGLAVIKKLITQAKNHLRYHKELTTSAIPQLWIEIGYKQADSVLELMHQAGYARTLLFRDAFGNDRCVQGMLE
ncbi:peptide chain release factor N(5)-glutamine methyltransferase [Candidatus Dependentiae bacterium]|nr:peptide chain release factor N(5)-glutamine methyltransferase [Candidatus Dependentiae bacterium]